MGYFRDFLVSLGMTTDATGISKHEIRAFILYLQQKRCFSRHRFNHPLERGLSPHTVHCYLRSVRAFFSWLVAEEVIAASPFERVKVPRLPRKVIPAFSALQIGQLLSAIDTATAEGYRNYAIILALLDSGLRVSELCGLRLSHLRLEEGILKVMGKGNKEPVPSPAKEQPAEREPVAVA